MKIKFIAAAFLGGFFVGAFLAHSYTANAKNAQIAKNKEICATEKLEASEAARLAEKRAQESARQTEIQIRDATAEADAQALARLRRVNFSLQTQNIGFQNEITQLRNTHSGHCANVLSDGLWDDLTNLPALSDTERAGDLDSGDGAGASGVDDASTDSNAAADNARDDGGPSPPNGGD